MKVYTCAPTHAGLTLVLCSCVCAVHSDYNWDSKDFLYMGTVDYSSVRSLCGHHPCPWDDLEGLAVCLLEMATGELQATLQLHVPCAFCGWCCKGLKASTVQQISGCPCVTAHESQYLPTRPSA